MRALVQHILSLVSNPILNFLYRWIYDGELEDTYHEVPGLRHLFVHVQNLECSVTCGVDWTANSGYNHPKCSVSKA